ncbi:hypothetical protein Tco_0399870 [Tanacetum coccineum]
MTRRGLAAAPQGGALGSGATMMNKVGEESFKPTSTVPEFRSNQPFRMFANVLDMSSDVMDCVPPSVATYASLHRDQLHATDERRRPQLGGTHRNTRNPHYMSQAKVIAEDDKKLVEEMKSEALKTLIGQGGEVRDGAEVLLTMITLTEEGVMNVKNASGCGSFGTNTTGVG